MVPVIVAVVLLGALLVGVTLGARTGDEPDAAKPSESASQSPTASATPSPTPSPTAPPRPSVRGCYRLDYRAAVAPTSDATAVPCSRQHTSTTFAVGDLDVLVDGHLLAVDSARISAQVARTCPRRFATYVGGSKEDRRLTMLRSVWFTPTVEQSDAGASWYRCDAVALASDERLAPLTRRVKGAMERPKDRDHYAMCGTAAPDARDFERVICSAKHSWRAVSTVSFKGTRYPGVAKVRAAGKEPCKDAGAEAADGELDYKWGYEWPTAEQWKAGQRYGLCWAPD